MSSSKKKIYFFLLNFLFWRTNNSYLQTQTLGDIIIFLKMQTSKLSPFLFFYSSSFYFLKNNGLYCLTQKCVDISPSPANTEGKKCSIPGFSIPNERERRSKEEKKSCEHQLLSRWWWRGEQTRKGGEVR